ncbi:hypothetical protein CIK05_04800 [Bdellovibrio sp. qaytius]|nr:hypothetical protein CIK05_04800 [Bdellovibrio sp. qaytius]
MKKLLALAVLIFVNTSCTTQFKKAQNLMAERNFDEALTIMEELVVKDPKDSDYQVGLKKAREGVIDQTLIRVRMARLANNNQESLELLRKTVDRENNWGLFPTGAVAFTQNEESDEAYKTLRTEVYSLNQRQRHLRVLYLIERYKILFPESRRKTFDLAFNDAKTHAKKFCLEKSSTTSNKTYFYNQLISKWCSYASQKAAIVKSESPLYEDLTILTKEQFQPSLPAALIQSLDKTMNEQFVGTGWFDKNSKKALDLTTTGNYQFSENRFKEFRTHTYSEPVITKAADGSTKTVNESRSYPYYATVISQEVNAGLNIVASDERIPRYQNAFHQTARESSHDYYNAAIGLRPERTGESFSSGQWLDIVAKKYSTELQSHLRSSFEGVFCSPLTDSTPRIELINQSLICLRQMSKNPPEVISRVFENEYQMTSIEMETLFKVVE